MVKSESVKTTCETCIMYWQHPLTPLTGFCSLHKLSYVPDHTCHIWTLATDGLGTALAGYDLAVLGAAFLMVKQGAMWKDENDLIHLIEAHKIIRKRLSKETEVMYAKCTI